MSPRPTRDEAEIRRLERELSRLTGRMAELEHLGDRRAHLFMDLRAAGVTQKRIGEIAGEMSDVGVVLAIRRHGEAQAKLRRAIERAADDFERDELTAKLCPLCAAEEPTAATS